MQATSLSNRAERRRVYKRTGYKIMGVNKPIVEYPRFGRKIMRLRKMKKQSEMYETTE